MKILFFLLALGNLLFFFWEFHQGAFEQQHQLNASKLPAIYLAEEVQSPKSEAIASPSLEKNLLGPLAKSTVQPENTAGMEQKVNDLKRVELPCYEIGAFPDHQSAISWLAGQVFDGELFEKEVSIPSSFLVYASVDKDPEKLKQQKILLAAKGISDMWVVPAGELKGLLSLGVFNDIARAAIFKNQLLQRGVTAEIKERFRTQSKVFVRYRSDERVQNLYADLVKVKCQKP